MEERGKERAARRVGRKTSLRTSPLARPSTARQRPPMTISVIYVRFNVYATVSSLPLPPTPTKLSWLPRSSIGLSRPQVASTSSVRLFSFRACERCAHTRLRYTFLGAGMSWSPAMFSSNGPKLMNHSGGQLGSTPCGTLRLKEG